MSNHPIENLMSTAMNNIKEYLNKELSHEVESKKVFILA